MSDTPRGPRRAVDVLALAAWRLEAGQAVDVDLLVTETKTAAGSTGPVTVSGTVGESTNTTVLVLLGAGERLTRVPWCAVAAIRTQVPAAPHPGL